MIKKLLRYVEYPRKWGKRFRAGKASCQFDSVFGDRVGRVQVYNATKYELQIEGENIGTGLILTIKEPIADINLW